MKARDAARHVSRLKRAAPAEGTSMLYVSLAVSGLLLVAANWAARGKHPVGGTVGAGMIAAVAPMCLMFTMPAVLLQAALLCVALLVLLVPERGRRLYVPASVVATLAAYANCTVSVVFTPSDLGTRAASLDFTSSASNSPHSAAVTGKGVLQMTTTPANLSFGGVAVGSSSAVKTVTLTNNTSGSLPIIGISLSGSAPGDRTARYPLRARTVTFRPGTLTAMRRHSPPNTVFDGV